MPAYRPNVALILQNSAGQILICQRSDWPESWQFPQGGMKRNETLLEALHREVREELGLEPCHYTVVGSRGPYRYLFVRGRKKEGYDGQEQHYFLATANSVPPMRFDGESPEFQDARWIAPGEYDLAWVASIKRKVYRQVFQDFFGVTLDRRAPE